MNKFIIRDVVIIFLVGLLPLLWLSDNQVILGHDAGLALDPIMHFLDRIYVWSQRFSIGTDQNGALLGAFFIHGFEAFLAYIGLNLQWGQIVQFIFWFTLPGLSMYFFAYKIFEGKRYLPLIAAVIYMLNFYLLQGWFIAERTKFSIYIAFPLVLYFLISYLMGRTNFPKSVLGSGIVLGIFNGGGSIPLYGGLAFTVLTIYLYFFFLSPSFSMFKKIIFYTFGTAFIYFLLNAYWLIPYAFYLSGFAQRDLAAAGGAEGALSWARYLSAQSSFINIFRGQGIPDWYLNPYHAYSNLFLRSPFLIVFSFLFPALAFSSVLFAKVKKEIFFIFLLILISLVGVVLSAGPESQFGFIFNLMVQYIPGFAMFRSAFYKFDYMVWFSYALLIGFTLDYLLSSVELKRFPKKSLLFSSAALGIFVIAYVLYHYPVLNGSFFDYSKEPGKELTTRVKVPDYVLEFGKWVNSQDINTRYLIMPQLGPNPYISYKWKYWSIAPPTSLLTRNSFVQNSQLASESERTLMVEMYNSFLRGDMEAFSDFLDVFAIDSIVVQKDYDWENPTWGTVNPLIYDEILKSHPDLFTHQKTFGEWEVYKVANQTKSLRVNSSTKLTFLQGKLAKVVSFPNFAAKSPLFLSDMEGRNIDYYARSASEIYLAPECIQCDLEYKEETFKYYNPKLLPGSLLYPLVTFKEDKVRASANDLLSEVNFYVTIANRRITEIKWMVDSKKRIEQILPTIERYRATLEGLANALKKEDVAVSENKAAQFAMNNILAEIDLVDSAYKEPILSIYQRDALSQAYDDITQVQRIARKKMWVTEDMSNKKYIYDLPVLGSYDIYVKRGSLTDPSADPKDTTITFKDMPDVLKPTSTAGDWLHFGKVELNNKKIFIGLKDGTMANLINTISPSFPDGGGGIVVDGENVTLTVDSLNKCFEYQFHNLEYMNTQYALSFSYRNFSDNNKLSFFNLSEGDKYYKYSTKNSTLPSFRYFTKFTKLITPKDGNIKLVFCNSFLSTKEMGDFQKQFDEGLLPLGKNLIEIKNITFNKVAYPNILLYKKQRDINDQNTVQEFVKKDPVTYEVGMAQSSDPVTLMMRESFGRYWRVCDEKNNCLPLGDKSHFATGGFANAWYLKDNPLSGKLRIYYYPQRWYILGTIITLISAGAILIYLCLKILKIR